MSQKRLSGFTAALMVSTLGFVPVSRADQTEVVATRVNPGLTLDSPLSPPTSPAAFDPQAYWRDTRQPDTGASSTALPAQRESSPASATAVKVGASQSADQNSVPTAAATMAQVVPHAFDQYQAATLYLRGIPVITFLDPNPRNPLSPTRKLPSSAKASDPAGASLGDKAMDSGATDSQSTSARSEQGTEEPTDPVLRATSVAALLNYLHQSGLQADSIQVRWDEDHEVYQVYVDDPDLRLPGAATASLSLSQPNAAQPSPETPEAINPSTAAADDRDGSVPTVVVIDRHTISPDTTGDLAEDALQVANRLRRLLGNAAPLTTVERPNTPAYTVQQARVQRVIQGMASWYGPGFHGRRSANGEIYNQHALTAAHRSLPFGTQVRVTNLQTGRSVVVRINDRGPYSGNRVIDLSAAAAQYIGMIHSGVAMVRLDVLE